MMSSTYEIWLIEWNWQPLAWVLPRVFLRVSSSSQSLLGSSPSELELEFLKKNFKCSLIIFKFLENKKWLLFIVVVICIRSSLYWRIGEGFCIFCWFFYKRKIRNSLRKVQALAIRVVWRGDCHKIFKTKRR